jgi:hypothetical protein
MERFVQLRPIVTLPNSKAVVWEFPTLMQGNVIRVEDRGEANGSQHDIIFCNPGGLYNAVASLDNMYLTVTWTPAEQVLAGSALDGFKKERTWYVKAPPSHNLTSVELGGAGSRDRPCVIKIEFIQCRAPGIIITQNQ